MLSLLIVAFVLVMPVASSMLLLNAILGDCYSDRS